MVKSEHATHANPVWADRTNYMVQVDITELFANDGRTSKFEQLWTRQVSNTQFELCCIPFFIYDVALGDIIEMDGAQIVRVVERSGRFVLRVWFGESHNKAGVRDRVIEYCYENSLLHEWSSEHLLAIDAPDWHAGGMIRKFLTELESAGLLEYEMG